MRRLIAPLLAAVATVAAADDGKQILNAQCAGCHALEKPAHADLDHIWERKGPDLYYAGNKFQREWLEGWLQEPTRIRPAGEFYRKHVKPGPDGDVVDTATLTSHPKLGKDDAEKVAAALMEIKTPNLVEEGGFKGGEVSASLGAMFFGKLRGCSACHENAPDSGGFSGPELYDAGKRLQADYVYSYIKHPQSFDPHVWMPDLGLVEADLQRLTGYVMQLKEGGSK
jgi:mono/diheme cytochrome c family protein